MNRATRNGGLTGDALDSPPRALQSSAKRPDYWSEKRNRSKMSDTPRKPGKSDSWQNLAKDLFGIDVTPSQADEDESFEVIDLASLSPDAAEAEPETAPSSSPAEPEPASQVKPASASTDDDEFGDIIFDDDAEVASDSVDEPVAVEPEPVKDEPEETVPEKKAAATPRKPAREEAPKKSRAAASAAKADDEEDDFGIVFDDDDDDLSDSVEDDDEFEDDTDNELSAEDVELDDDEDDELEAEADDEEDDGSASSALRAR